MQFLPLLVVFPAKVHSRPYDTVKQSQSSSVAGGIYGSSHSYPSDKFGPAQVPQALS